ncbi:hypothetical protein AHAS_Ahas09G0152200 [Arachis hypogaea]
MVLRGLFHRHAAHRCITSMRRQHGMSLDERIMPYLQMASLSHLAKLNDYQFKFDEPLVSAFVKRWRPETHTFHMSLEECTIMLQDVAPIRPPHRRCVSSGGLHRQVHYEVHLDAGDI